MSRGQFGKVGVYNATPITLSDQESSSVALDSAGNLYVTPASGASFGNSTADGATFTQGTTTGGLAMGVYVSSPQTLTTGKAGAIALDVNRNVMNAEGKAEDAGHTSGDRGVFALAVRNDTATALAGTTLDYIPLTTDANGGLWVSQATLLAGEDLTVNRMMVEQRFSYSAIAVADIQIKAGAGFLHTVTFSCADAAPTAGDIKIYDSLTETGTVVFHHNFTTTPFMPFTVTLDYTMATGIYIGFTTTADVNVSCSYR